MREIPYRETWPRFPISFLNRGTSGYDRSELFEFEPRVRPCIIISRQLAANNTVPRKIQEKNLTGFWVFEIAAKMKRAVIVHF